MLPIEISGPGQGGDYDEDGDEDEGFFHLRFQQIKKSL
jgi:hypothetical protein